MTSWRFDENNDSPRDMLITIHHQIRELKEIAVTILQGQGVVDSMVQALTSDDAELAQILVAFQQALANAQAANPGVDLTELSGLVDATGNAIGNIVALVPQAAVPGPSAGPSVVASAPTPTPVTPVEGSTPTVDADGNPVDETGAPVDTGLGLNPATTSPDLDTDPATPVV